MPTKIVYVIVSKVREHTSWVSNVLEMEVTFDTYLGVENMTSVLNKHNPLTEEAVSYNCEMIWWCLYLYITPAVGPKPAPIFKLRYCI